VSLSPLQRRYFDSWRFSTEEFLPSLMDRVISPGFEGSLDSFFPDATAAFLVEVAGFWAACFLVATTIFFPDGLPFVDDTCFLVAGAEGFLAGADDGLLAGAGGFLEWAVGVLAGADGFLDWAEGFSAGALAAVVGVFLAGTRVLLLADGTEASPPDVEILLFLGAGFLLDVLGAGLFRCAGPDADAVSIT
jgi:hypothetical protein